MDTNTDLHADSSLMNMSHSFLGDGLLSLSIPGPRRDPAYYIPDGNSVLLVENTLFRVHRSTLTKDKSAFETMFQLSTEADSSRSESSITVAQEGERDDNPIRLQGDTAEEFRALLWALYSLPHELMLATGPEANCAQLVRLARISHKYQFKSIENWALQALYMYYNEFPAAFESLPSSATGQNPETSSPTLVQITEISALCERTDLLSLAVLRWKRQITEGKDVALAINIGERFNLRSMLGLAYYSMMLKGRTYWESESLLTREQRIRLLCGYYSLSKLWDSLPSQAPAVTHSPRCSSQQRCGKAWAAMWKAVLDVSSTIIPTLPREDIVARVMLAECTVKAMVEAQIPSQGFIEGIPHCKESALFATTVRVKEIKETLADYFSDEF